MGRKSAANAGSNKNQKHCAYYSKISKNESQNSHRENTFVMVAFSIHPLFVPEANKDQQNEEEKIQETTSDQYTESHVKFLRVGATHQRKQNYSDNN